MKNFFLNVTSGKSRFALRKGFSLSNSCCILHTFYTNYYIDIKVTINSLRSNFSLNLAFYYLRKLNLSSFVRIYHKKKIFIGFTCFKTFKMSTGFLVTLQNFLQLINLIDKHK